MAIPGELELALSAEVSRLLETELGVRGLLLGSERLAAAEADAAERGVRLLRRAVEACYPAVRRGAAAELDLGAARDAARLASALAFGAVTARVLAHEVDDEVELLCATFNLGIGLVDALCDRAPELGGPFLDLVRERDLRTAAGELRPRGWLQLQLPPPLATDATASFTAVVVEVFFETLHAVYPHDRWVEFRGGVGVELLGALEAERRSVAWAAEGARLEELVETSRLTSVLPFRILETLAVGGSAVGGPRPSAGERLGEAMWRIDDLVDLGADVRSGALNGILLRARGAPRATAGGAATVLERLLASGGLSTAAVEAAESLQAGLTLAAPSDERAASFLGFVQRYAGIEPHLS